MLIGIIGGKGQGKSTIARHLWRDHGFAVVKFADPLKDMLTAIGLRLDELEGDLKETPCALLCGKTPRFAMQTLGTEWGRDQIDPRFWEALWRDATRRTFSYGLDVVTDDVRFPNEMQAVRDLGGHLLRVVRPGARTDDSHASEAIAVPADWEVPTFINDETIAGLTQRVDAWMSGLRGEA